MILLKKYIVGVIFLTDFKESPIMYGIALAVIAFIIAQSLFFAIKSWKHGKKLGITSETLKNTVISSVIFTIAPSISILVTVIVLANALGIVLPWIRLSVVGNLAYETVAAETSLGVLGGSLSNPVDNPVAFSTIAWAMTIGAGFPLFYLPLVCKKLQMKIGDTINKNDNTKKLGDVLSAAAFIGIISAFIARAINGCATTKELVLDSAGNQMLNEAGEAITKNVITESSGVISILTLICAIIFMLIFTALCQKVKKLEKFESFAMPLAMFAAMGCAILFTKVLPAELSTFTWYSVGGVM